MVKEIKEKRIVPKGLLDPPIERTLSSAEKTINITTSHQLQKRNYNLL